MQKITNGSSIIEVETNINNIDPEEFKIIEDKIEELLGDD